MFRAPNRTGERRPIIEEVQNAWKGPEAKTDAASRGRRWWRTASAAPFKRYLVQATVVTVLLLLWEWLVSQHGDTLVPKPSKCFLALYELVRDGILWPDLLASLQRVSIGFAIAVVLGVLIGFLLGLVAAFKEVFTPAFELLRPIPPIAWIPIAVALLGIGNPSAWFVIFIGAFYPVLTNTLLGVSGVEKLHVEAAKVLGASGLRSFFHVVLPSSLPSVFAGLRVGLGFAWMCVVAAEMFASRSGLGYAIQLNRQVFQLDRVVAGMITIAIVGFIMSQLMARLEWLFVPWRREFLAKDFFTSIVTPRPRLPTLRNDPTEDARLARGRSNWISPSSSPIAGWDSLGGTSVSIERLQFAYPGNPPVLRDINLEVKPREVFCILGVSGCGKSTLLRLLAGLETTYSGSIAIGGEQLSDHRADVTMVFQNFSLFPWKSVEKNVRFAIDQRDTSDSLRREEARQLLRLVGLAHKARTYPHQLSGGQQQRVAFARALAKRPRLLLLDEPFSALDSLTRETLQDEVSDLFKRTGITVIMVTHDIAEAIFMADRIAIMSPSGGKMLGEFTVPALRPRDREFRSSPEFRELARKLWQKMQPRETPK
jgi:NitT/TauT family transport system ATP-binding protein